VGTALGVARVPGGAAREVAAAGPSVPGRERTGRIDFKISLNTSTLRGHKLPITEVIDIAGEAGYAGIEPWPDELGRYVDGGGSLNDLRKRLNDLGLLVTGAIAFPHWMVDDEAVRQKAFEEARRQFHRLSQIGASHMALPPAGDVAGVELLAAAERYRELLDISQDYGVIPAVEVWGFARNLYRLGQTALVAVEADHPQACVLPDVYHLYKGGSGLGGIRCLHGSLYGGFHLNDIPADAPPREEITDAHRVYPGDGIMPLAQMLRDLHEVGYRGAVSVELFNPEYYQQDPRHVARTALAKTQAVIAAAEGIRRA
jgi:2-keto-myo-inositol isomerase